ncbi:accessory Sec system protein Asp3 [Lactococcus sp. S64]|uniref:accessory Sec system protein Asp3 n=1 Tax=Lactococcus sp. S64 TaxID=2767459 RepID=UPI001905054D|nr:accessory Sec system protein Asp3 [Lactococcus sp. S64]MBK0084548.1 accessory Sec system protein Asp3 [Lactococcus sp. S64]
MSELYLMRWPQNLSAVYANGATIRYSKDQSVYYANEVLSPGQTICTWASATNYLSSGNSPALPLLKSNQAYELSLKLEADNDLPVQVQIDFFDGHQEVIDSYRGTDSRLSFTVPNGMVSYEVRLVNLKHEWLQFEFLTIGTIGAAESILETQFRRHYDWVHVRPLRGSNQKTVQLIVNQGPRSILPLSLDERCEVEQIFITTDGQAVEPLIQSLAHTLGNKPDAQLSLEAGLGYYHLPSEFIIQLKVGLKQIEILGGRNNDKLDH